MLVSSLLTFVILCALSVVSPTVCAITCNLGQYATTSGCKKCPKGTYNEEKSNATSCTPCSMGTYAAVSGVVSSELCLECPIDSKSSEGSATCTPCKNGFVRACDNCVRCPPGTRVLQYGKCSCQKCEKNSIAPGWNTDSCVSCPLGFVPNFQRSKCVPGKCDLGYQADGNECIPCDHNTYRNGSMIKCEPCPLGFVTNNFDGPNTACFQCPAGYYTTDLLPQTYTYENLPLCMKCPPNSTTKGVGKFLCRRIGSDCAPNSIEDSDGDCKSCDYNHRMDFEKRTCVPCAEGYSSPRGAFKECTKCPDGAVGSYYGRCTCKEGLGLQGDKCIACEKGSASLSYSDECAACYSGSIAPCEGMSACLKCPEGTRTEGSDRTKCVSIPKCNLGFFYGRDTSVSYSQPECLSMRTGCADGLERILLKGASVCVDSNGRVVCPPGSVYDNVSKCVGCRIDSYLAKAPASMRLKCKRCPLKSISIGGSSRTCTPCPTGFTASKSFDDTAYCFCKEGRYIRESDGACVWCPTGSVSNIMNSRTCQKCEKGFTALYNKRTCVCAWPKIIDHYGNCVEESNPLMYER